jgi:hypothetical protein
MALLVNTIFLLLKLIVCMEKINLTKAKTNGTNPFILELKGKMYLQPRVNTIVAKGEAIANTITGEITQGSVLLGRKRIVDKSQFAKIYASEIGILFELSKSAINVFLYLSRIMDYEQRAIFVPTKDYKKIDYKSENPAINGIKELMRNGIIAVGRVYGEWWLNPTIVCKGERFAIYTEYIQESQPIVKGNKEISEQYEAAAEELDQETKNKIALAEKKYRDQQLPFNE